MRVVNKSFSKIENKYFLSVFALKGKAYYALPMTKTEHIENVKQAAEKIKSLAGDIVPKTAFVLGSGLGVLADEVEDKVVIPYADLPGFPVPTVEGHAGEIVLGRMGGKDVLFLNGRVHTYETNDFYPLKTLIRTVRMLGIENLFLSSASGSLRDEIAPGQIMIIRDHINMMGINPLIGDNDDEFGPRFPPMGNAWDADLREKLLQTAKQENIALHSGVFIGFRGPTFETPAEIKMARSLGADAVGMSSVPECILARHCGLKVMGCAVITNFGAGMSDEELSHAQTLEGSALAADSFKKLLRSFIFNYLP